MTAREGEQALGRIGVCKQVELAFRRCRTGPLADAGAVDAADGRKAGPVVVGQPGDVGGDARRTRFHPAMPGVGFLVLQDGHERVAEERLHVVEQRRLVAFQGRLVSSTIEVVIVRV